MRWPWQRARPPLGAPTVQRVAGPPAESRAGWAFLPPLQRTVGDAELTSAPMAFVDALPTRARPMLTGPMSHAVSPVAPSGVLDGDGGRLATPSTRSSDIDLALVPPAPRPTPGRPAVAVQRQATGTLVGLGAPPADVPPLHAVPLDTDLEGAAADGEGLGGPEWPAPVGDVPILSAPDGDVPVPSVAVAGTPVPSAPAGALPIPWAAAGAPTGPGAQRSATPLVPAPPAADRAGSEEGATFVELPARLAGREPDPAPPATVQRRIGLGAPLRASEAASVAPPATVSPARERPAQGAPEPAVAPRLEVGVDLPLVQRSADPSGTAPTEPSPPAAEPPVQPAEPLDQPAAATAPHAPDPTPTPTTGPLGDLLTALPVTGEPRPTGDAPATIPSPAFEPPVVARQIAHRTGEDLAGEPPATTGAPVRPAADPHPGGPGASPTAAPLVQRASIDPPTVGGTIPTVAPPVRGGGAPVRATSPTTGLPVRPVSSPPPPAGAAAPETAPLLQRSSVPPTISPPSPTTGPAVERSGAPTPELPDAPGPGLPVVARAVADGAPDLDEAPTGLLDVLPLPSDPAPTTSGPSRPGTPVVQRAPLLSVARAPLLATSPRPPSTLAPHAGRPAPVSPSRSAVVQRADVAPVPAPVSLHALATPAPSSAAMPRTPDSRLAVTPPASPAAAGPMPVQPLPVQRVDAVVAMPAHPVQRAAGPSAGETDALPEEAVQTLTEPPTVQAVTPPEPASEPGPRGGSPSPFAAASAADLDELARRLTPPLLRRVRGQLLVDRERRGVRVDL